MAQTDFDTRPGHGRRRSDYLYSADADVRGRVSRRGECPEESAEIGSPMDTLSPDDDGSRSVELADVGAGVGVEDDRVGRGSIQQAGQAKVGPGSPGSGGDRLMR